MYMYGIDGLCLVVGSSIAIEPLYQTGVNAGKGGFQLVMGYYSVHSISH